MKHVLWFRGDYSDSDVLLAIGCRDWYKLGIRSHVFSLNHNELAPHVD